MDALLPGLRLVVNVLAERLPPRAAVLLVGHWDAWQQGLLVLLEGYHLQRHGASFAEHFFGLQRQQVCRKASLTSLEKVALQRRRLTAPRLTAPQRLASVLEVCVLPGIRRALDARLAEAERLPAHLRSPWQRWLVRLYPWLSSVLRSVSLAYRIMYLLGRSPRWSPSLHLLGLQLVRAFPEQPPQAGERSRWQQLLGAASAAGTGALWGGVYLMQFAQWWFQREHLLQPYRPKAVPPAPLEREAYRDAGLSGAGGVGAQKGALVLLPEDRAVCPLCHGPRRNPAASCSGYVFCYACLVQHVRQHGACPVSGLPMDQARVRRVRDGSDAAG